MNLSAVEETELRTSVHGIVAGFGNDYFTHLSETLQPPTELWDALAAGGFVGVNLPEEYGGGGMGLSAMSAPRRRQVLPHWAEDIHHRRRSSRRDAGRDPHRNGFRWARETFGVPGRPRCTQC
jgi:hypothetical protein